ncbi:hypothetical protein V1L54_08025 [Streptomyces sp. TRM 70361]|uniref:hypothetical protein n=1 Tax=Streptomyces sp. TRM 70361 TaxID=3116553 RepID=UPI002E7B99B7|nr:hypothetical protein [Streptomyces sp. TRM 70361]MEE1939361.1 hypothetical protein [Streptomyces sp. TRM 70361]
MGQGPYAFRAHRVAAGLDAADPGLSGAVPHGGPAPLPGDFDEELRAVVLDLAPRQFAVVQTWEVGDGERDGRVVAWGVAYGDGSAEVVSTDGVRRFSLAAPERAVRWFGVKKEGVTARLVWLAAPDRTTAA